MKNKVIESTIAIAVALLIAAVIGWAGSDGGITLAGLSLFALAGVFAFLVQWVVFVPSYLAQTEHYYDLTGSLTYLAVVIAALAAMTSEVPAPLGLIGLIGIAIWAGGFAIELISDRQKGAFRRDPANAGRFITSGFWAWSRHPNYFGEIVLWIGIALIALPSLSGWQYATLISPLFVFVLITRISGIPPLEARAETRWGDEPEFQAYKARTPALFPRMSRGTSHGRV